MMTASCFDVLDPVLHGAVALAANKFNQENDAKTEASDGIAVQAAVCDCWYLLSPAWRRLKQQ